MNANRPCGAAGGLDDAADDTALDNADDATDDDETAELTADEAEAGGATVAELDWADALDEDIAGGLVGDERVG